MNRSAMDSSKRRLWTGLMLLTLIFSLPAVAATDAATSPEPGSYCPSPDILLVTAEELSASLDLVMRSRAALVVMDRTAAINELASAGTALHLAASRGASARTIQLLDAIIKAKAGKDYAQMLTWFPVLHTSLLTLPDNATVRAADDLIGHAEDVMQRLGGGDPLKYLSEARHMLACDGLDIPLQTAIQAQSELLEKLGQRSPPQKNAYDPLLDSLRNALAYSLGHSEK